MAKELKYFRTRLHGLKIVVGEPSPGQIEQESVSFVPYFERWDGDRIKVGYLETDNSVAIEKLTEDINVDEISEKEFKEATDTNRKDKPAVRAAY